MSNYKPQDFAEMVGVSVRVNNEKMSPHEKLVQDLISIIHVFSCRIYGLGKYKKKIREDEEIVQSI
jgi:predicted site-specific integrase-resolvase